MNVYTKAWHTFKDYFDEQFLVWKCHVNCLSLLITSANVQGNCETSHSYAWQGHVPCYLYRHVPCFHSHDDTLPFKFGEVTWWKREGLPYVISLSNTFIMVTMPFVQTIKLCNAMLTWQGCHETRHPLATSFSKHMWPWPLTPLTVLGLMIFHFKQFVLYYYPRFWIQTHQQTYLHTKCRP